MQWRHRCAVLVVSGVLLSLAAVGGAAAEPTDGPTVTNATVGGSTESTLMLTKTLSLTPERPGEITVTARYDTPESLASLQLTVDDEHTVTSRQGFTGQDGRYVWDEQTTRPQVTYRLPVNETRDTEGPLARDGEFLFVDVGPWAIVRTPGVATNATARGPVTFEQSTTVSGAGVAGDRITYLGPSETYERTAHGQQFRLVVPERADMAEEPAAILDAMGAASDALRVGDRDSSVLLIAAPTTSISWAVGGIQTGDAELWTRDQARLDSADNVWIHEYVHTRQDYETTDATRWTVEASATYYAALFALEADRIDFRRFRDRLAVGEQSRYADVILSDPDSWNGVGAYTKGALVAGDLDRRIRLAGDGSSFQTVFRRMNAHDSSITASAFREMVESAANRTVASVADRYTTTTETPAMWDSDAHRAAFDVRLATIGYAFDAATNQSAYRVTGPYRTGPASSERPIRLAVGERLTTAVIVANSGNGAGDYDVPVLLDGTTIGRVNGTLPANTTIRHPISHTFTAVGRYTLSAGDARVGITVERLPNVTVAGLKADRTEHTAGDTVTLTATVTNDEPIPARSNLTLHEDTKAVETRQVTLMPEEQRTIQFRKRLTGVGTTQFRLGQQRLTVEVRAPPTATETTTADTPTEQPTTSGAGAGFGVGVALVALLFVAGRTVDR